MINLVKFTNPLNNVINSTINISFSNTNQANILASIEQDKKETIYLKYLQAQVWYQNLPKI